MVTHPVIVIMGVAGSGKTTVGALLAGRLRWPYAEADNFHPLTDADRGPWLEAIGRWIDERGAADEPGVVSCSGLKRAYRDMLRDGRPEVRMVFLQGSRELILRRMVARHGHFMKADMLDSQFADLEEPGPDEDVLVISVEHSPEEIVDQIIAGLELKA